MRRYIRFYLILITFMLLYPLSATAASQFVVVIDAGHGGGDIGTPHRKYKEDEKTIALNVALKLGKMIEANHPDVKIVYTRTTDVYPTLPDRTRMAREAKGDLFISIHVNAALDSRAKGVETYVFGITGLKGKSADEQKRIRERTMIERENLDIDGKQIDFETAVDIETKILCQTQREKHNKYSLEVAHYVQDNIMSALRQSDYRSKAFDRGVKQKNIFVLCYSPMPAILIELGYMSNAAEEKFMNSENAKVIYAQAIYKGFEQYHNNWKRRQLSDPNDEIPPLPALSEPQPLPETASATDQTSEQTATAPQAKSTAHKPVRLVKIERETVKQEDLKEQAQSAQTAQPAQPAQQAQTAQPAQQLVQPAQAVKTVPQTQPTQQVAVQQQTQPVQQQTQPVQQQTKPVQQAVAQTEVPVGAPVPMVPARECFRIQFISSTTHFKRGDKILKDLWPVYCYEANGYYRYTYGEGATKADLQNDIQKVRAKFHDAFVVHFDAQGQRIR